MEKILSILFSTRTTGFLFIVYIFSMAAGTFIEEVYETPAAKFLIYNARWFEILQLILILNFIGNISKYKLLRLNKLPILCLHLAFIFIFIGGGITRYISYEGMMHIREGESSNEVVSDKAFVQVYIDHQGDRKMYQPRYFAGALLPHSLSFTQQFKAKYQHNDTQLQLQFLDIIPRALETFYEDKNGKKVIQLVTTGENGRKELYLTEGEIKNINGILVSYNNPNTASIQIMGQGDSLQIISPFAGNYTIMASQQKGEVTQDSPSTLHLRALYEMGNLSFVIPQPPTRGIVQYEMGDRQENKELPSLLRFVAKSGEETDTISVFGRNGVVGDYKQFQLNGMNIAVSYGSQVYHTTFSIFLNDFIMERYPGSNSPLSYASEVTVIDEGKETPFRIFMNNILNYKGYRFYQSSFDPDEQGTVLSVNHDFWGTLITYIGYALLFGGLLLMLFWKGSHFRQTITKLSQLSAKSITLLLLLGSVAFVSAQHNHDASQRPESTTLSTEDISSLLQIDPSHSDKFGSLLVQKFDGRIVPSNTLALELLRKLTKKETFGEYDANQWFLSTLIIPADKWVNAPLIKIGDNGGSELKELTHANAEGYTSLANLYYSTPDGGFEYILEKQFNESFNKKPADQSKFDREVLAVNERVRIVEGLLSKQYFRFIPIPNDPNDTWGSGVNPETLQIQDSTMFAKLSNYSVYVVLGSELHKWEKADENLEKLKQLQLDESPDIIPSKFKIDSEILYNKLNLFFKLMIFYSIVGGLLWVLFYTKFFKEHKLLYLIEKILLGSLFIGFVVHLVGLAMRWYISGHAPWSNGYEAVVFISWVAVLAGFMFYNKKLSIAPIAGCLTAVMLMGFAHGSMQLDPQITPLQPVLQSYWLVIHVAVITSSYGFFGLSFILAFNALLLFIINRKSLETKLNKAIKEITYINELTCTVGLVLLAIGTFLGGIWANESWGRYWSWDPKETWAFISVIVYAFVLHMRLIPKLRGTYAFNVVSFVSFSSIIMTYFGVNYYLSGLHTYAAGDKIPIPNWVYITSLIMVLTIFASYFNKRFTIFDIKK